MLRALPQWTGRNARKIPLDPHTGGFASTKDPATWASYAEAVEFVKACPQAVGLSFVTKLADGLVGIDLDHVIDPAGTITADAEAVVADLDSYTEISPSGRGLRVFVGGRLPGHGRKRGDFECYEDARAFSITGQHLAGTPLVVEGRPDELLVVHRRIFPPPPPAARSLPRTGAPRRSDRDVLEQAGNAKNGAAFTALFSGDDGAYSSRSEADLALCSHLAFWCAGDAQQMDALFRASGLMRPKWDTRRGSHTYGQQTIAKAVAGVTEFYGERMRRTFRVEVA